ncbi:MAG: hypothetical protein JJU45_16135 [Acidimicrobiia bacterium]|nr:hypothetical protein [Acidimicrobiia bacterium]
MSGFVDWFFRDRRTGRIVIAQFPNLPLWIAIGSFVLARLVTIGSEVEQGLEVVTAAALLWWAADELLRGVNPWRRLLGAVVAVVVVVAVVGRLG